MDEEKCLDMDEELANKLKENHTEHFQNLVRMHLSFALELNIEETEEPAEKKFAKWGFKKKSDKKDKDVTDGTPLTSHGMAQMGHIIDFLSLEENIIQEGIFRRTGALSRQMQLKNILNEGSKVDFNASNFSVHDCASVLKNYLSDLPEPLVTDALYPIYCQVSDFYKTDVSTEDRLRSCLQLLTLLLPENNRLMLKSILDLLRQTADYAHLNKMSSENLATLFTPHVLCPRKLCGAAFHANAQQLYKIVQFMIESACDLFKIPSGLAADIRLFWHEKEKKKQLRCSPGQASILNESVADGCVVNTVFSFVDREKTAKENVTNPTEAALAQLYAHIQSLPESAKKRKLVAKFNKENGYGTPKSALLSAHNNNNNNGGGGGKLNLGDSLKRHIFSGKRTAKYSTANALPNSTPQSSSYKAHPMKLFEKSLDCIDCASSDASSDGKTPYYGAETKPDVLKRAEYSNSAFSMDEKSPEWKAAERGRVAAKEEERAAFEDDVSAKIEDHVSAGKEENFSNDKVSADFSTRKVDVSPKKCDILTKIEDEMRGAVGEDGEKDDTAEYANRIEEKVGDVLRVCQSTPSNARIAAVPRRITMGATTPGRFCCTSTPAQSAMTTPPNGDDVSPITMSAQKMPKAMREMMMTPRSRNPVIALSNSNISNLKERPSTACGEPLESVMEGGSFVGGGDELTETFKEYLQRRSMVTASTESTFSSCLDDDFNPSPYSSDDKLSESLLFCLDGGTPSEVNSSQSFSDGEFGKGRKNRGKPVHETVL